MFDNFRVDFKHFYSGGQDILGLVRSESNGSGTRDMQLLRWRDNQQGPELIVNETI